MKVMIKQSSIVLGILSAVFVLAGVPTTAPLLAGENTLGLPPAEYKGLPKGTRVSFTTGSVAKVFTVTRNEGFEYTYKIDNSWLYRYAKFGKQGYSRYSRGGPDRNEVLTELDKTSKSALVDLWPLKVGNRSIIRFELLVDTMGRWEAWNTTIVRWEIEFQVFRTEQIELNGKTYATYVIREHATGNSRNENYVPSVEYTATIWYNPNSGLILKSETDDTRGWTWYKLVSATFPTGITTHALTPFDGTQAPAASQLSNLPPTDTGNIENRLRELKKIYDMGLITDDEFRKKKHEISPTKTGTIKARLKELKELHDDGLINDDDYEKKKAVLLEQL